MRLAYGSAILYNISGNSHNELHRTFTLHQGGDIEAAYGEALGHLDALQYINNKKLLDVFIITDRTSGWENINGAMGKSINVPYRNIIVTMYNKLIDLFTKANADGRLLRIQIFHRRCFELENKDCGSITNLFNKVGDSIKPIRELCTDNSRKGHAWPPDNYIKEIKKSCKEW